MIRLYVQVTLVGTTALHLHPVMKEWVTATRTILARVTWSVVMQLMIQTTAGTSILRLQRRLTAASNHENQYLIQGPTKSKRSIRILKEFSPKYKHYNKNYTVRIKFRIAK